MQGIREEQGQAALKVTLRMIEMLQNPEDNQWRNNDFDDVRFLEKIQRKLYIVALVHYYHVRLQLSFLLGNYAEAIHFGLRAEQLDAYRFAWPIRVDTWFYLVLAFMRDIDGDAAPDAAKRRAHINELYKKLEAAEAHAPVNFRCRRLLVAAELARLDGRDADAGDLYDAAIADAATNEMVCIEALACELAGRFYMAKDKSRVAGIYFEDACFRYVQWGANAMVAQIQALYPGAVKGRRNTAALQESTMGTRT